MSRYAEAIRFGPAKAVKHTNHTLNSEWAPLCSQSFGKGVEDCLYINVFMPRRNTTNLLPVAVHIHGGSFARGRGDDGQWPHYGFARAGVVSVTFQYRVGLFGFMTLPQIAKESPEAPANFGLLDQRVALEWVRDNIHRFGGDAKQVTVFGESAGASSILYQLAYKNGTAPSLFHRAWIIGPPAVATPEYEINFMWKGFAGAADSLGCDSKLDNVTDCLRQIPSSELEYRKNRIEVFPYVNVMPGEYQNNGWPCKDSVNYPDLGDAFAAGQFDKSVIVVHGSDSDEGLMFAPISSIIPPSPWLLQKQMHTIYGEEKGEIIYQNYKPGGHARRPNRWYAFGDLVGDTLLNCPTWVLARLAARNSDVPQYRYTNEWTYRHALFQFVGAFHTSSLVLFYHDLGAGGLFATQLDEDENNAAIVLFKKTIQFVRGEMEAFETEEPRWPKFEVAPSPSDATGQSESAESANKKSNGYTPNKGFDGKETALHVTKDEKTGNITIRTVMHWKSDDCGLWERLFPPHGMWAPAYKGDLWADEELLPRLFHKFVWIVLRNPREAGAIAGTLVILSIVLMIYKCYTRCCKSTSKDTKTPKLKKD